MRAILEYVDRVDVLARRNIAQRVCGSDHLRRVRIERARALHESIAQAALEQQRRERRSADAEQLLTRGFAQWFAQRIPRNNSPQHAADIRSRALIERRLMACKPRLFQGENG